jgi:hypothetical protein
MHDNKVKSPLQEFRAAVFKKQSAEERNNLLRCAAQDHAGQDVVRQIVAAFDNKNDIDRELIVMAATYGHVGMVESLTEAIPALQAQAYYDRALIAAAVSYFSDEVNYAAIVRVLIGRGADACAFEGHAISMAQDYHDKTLVLAALMEEKPSAKATPQKPAP